MNISSLRSFEIDLATDTIHELIRTPRGFELKLSQSGKAGTKNDNA
jgi:hypothetical protein